MRSKQDIDFTNWFMDNFCTMINKASFQYPPWLSYNKFVGRYGICFERNTLVLPVHDDCREEGFRDG